MMRVCMHVTACHNVGKAAYYTEGPYKKCFECIWYTADCVIRNIGTNAFFFSHLKFCFLFFKQTCIFYCPTCNNKKSEHFNDSKS